MFGFVPEALSPWYVLLKTRLLKMSSAVTDCRNILCITPPPTPNINGVVQLVRFAWRTW